MNGFFALLGGLAMLGVVVSLFIGIFGMARGGDFNARNGNRMMRWRVMLQGLALLLLALAMMLGSKS
ncbi:twin transmembrane helix small protein [Arenibaculum pallidiluteum]|uniref:twin transmembrane helix small protein n=1 Tax=Arenibaculum pallidiluteum TaxID=2812559 RepID=UPI001A97A029|nr:twin transmembrane helix small protein [Arenibaculum pallidiluteum]